MLIDRKEIEKRLGTITSDLLREKGYISFVDIFIKFGYLTQADYENWRTKKIPYLEKVIKPRLKEINFIMKTVRRNSLNGKLKSSWTAYKSWGKSRELDLQEVETPISKRVMQHILLCINQ